MNLEELARKSGSLERRVASKEKREVIKRAFYVDMSVADIAYFLEVQCSVVQSYFRVIGKRNERPYIKTIGFNSKDRLSYRRATQIYEAEDARFNASEISELLDLILGIVSYALENKEKIERKIVEALQFIKLL